MEGNKLINEEVKFPPVLVDEKLEIAYIRNVTS